MARCSLKIQTNSGDIQVYERSVNETADANYPLLMLWQQNKRIDVYHLEKEKWQFLVQCEKEKGNSGLL